MENEEMSVFDRLNKMDVILYELQKQFLVLHEEIAKIASDVECLLGD